MLCPRTSKCFNTFCIGTLLCVVAHSNIAETLAADLWQMNLMSLATFEFEGVPLGASVSEFKRHVPSARPAYDRLEAQSDVECYTAGPTKTADGASLYFFRESLYQIELQYNQARTEAAGGMAVIVDSLIDKLGPPDYVDTWRRTWYQPGCNRRADFFIDDQRGKLVVTDTSLFPLIDRRLHDNEAKQAVEFGFEPEQR